MTAHRYVFALLAVLLASPLFAQAQLRPEFGLNFTVGVPQGAFARNVGGVAFGGDLHVGTHLGSLPILVGVDAGLQVYGMEHRHVPLSMTLPDITVGVQTTNNIAQAHLLLRLQPPGGAIRPYADLLYGVQYLFTQTSLQDTYEHEDMFSTTNFDDVTMSRGAGLGVEVRVFDGKLSENGRRGSVYLNVGVRYRQGGEAAYLREGDIVREAGTLRFSPTVSRVDMMQPRFGVTFKL